MMLVTHFIVYQKVNNRSKTSLVSQPGMHGYDVNCKESLTKTIINPKESIQTAHLGNWHHPCD